MTLRLCHALMDELFAGYVLVVYLHLNLLLLLV